MGKHKEIKSTLNKETIDEIITIVWNAIAEILIKTGAAIEIGEENEDAE